MEVRRLPHPRDEWVEVTALGDQVPTYLITEDDREAVIAEARELYALGRPSLQEFEALVAESLGTA